MDDADRAIEARNKLIGALIKWRANDQRRDHVVRQAAKAGIPKTEIAAITGLARSTIYEILGRPGAAP